MGAQSLKPHPIRTKSDVIPIRQRPYRVSPAQPQEIKKHVDQLLNAGLIRPSNSDWASPVVLVQKKDGSSRMCVDYRKLNEATVRDSFPIPLLDENLSSLHGSEFFTTLDMKSGYHQLLLNEPDCYKTAFTTSDGLFEFLVLPFGFVNASGIFQRAIQEAFGHNLPPFVLLYVDDIIIHSPSFSEHMEHLNVVFNTLQNTTSF